MSGRILPFDFSGVFLGKPDASDRGLVVEIDQKQGVGGNRACKLMRYCDLLCIEYASYGCACSTDWRFVFLSPRLYEAGSLGSPCDFDCFADCDECSDLAPDIACQRSGRFYGLAPLLYY